DANGNGVPDECEAVCTEAYCRCPVCGDVNGDGQVKVSDLTLFVSYLFRGGSAPVPLAVADVNGDGQVKVSDLTLFVSYLFRGGPPPTCGF
ncbi:MAG TPA: dockerin type I repeat-containing protein, partial [candidate division Zixibacteria bacterium]|nr:dockerin type I repeat-containing protein [candidate division Zixibacteria bacterium]